jgi:polyisoprenoid-binding protein YceI
MYGTGTRILAALLALVLVHVPARADTYVIDKGHTVVGFGWERAGLSRQQGRFTDVNGTIAFNPESPEASSVDVSIRASSIQTGVDTLDRHLRSADFFDVANHPVITFKSTAVIKTDDKTAQVAGDLTMLGVTKPMTLEVTWSFTGPHPLGAINPQLNGRIVSVFSARGTIERSQWGLTRVIPLVSDKIQITIETETLKK